MKLLCVAFSAISLFTVMVFAQENKRLVSTDVQPDGHVTFRFAAPNANKVEVSIEGQEPHVPMQKDDHGIWSATVGPLQPDFYGYSFVQDGVALMDPVNSLNKPNLLDPESEVHVPGDSLPWETTNIPHGVVHRHFYHSKMANEDRDFFVYTPPAYSADSKTDYPVLYLLHGFSDDASGWTAVGRANVILDNLINQGKAKPMIVVMPLGYGDFDVIRQHLSPTSADDKDLSRRNLSRFTDILLSEIVPQIESTYRVKRDRESRAIAGLSMGGAESLLTGLNHLDQFAWIGAFSSGGIDLRSFDQEFPNADQGVNSRLKLLWIACGTEDDLNKINRQFKSWLKQKGVQFTDIETPGMHTWLVWRRNLAALTPLLFQSNR